MYWRVASYTENRNEFKKLNTQATTKISWKKKKNVSSHQIAAIHIMLPQHNSFNWKIFTVQQQCNNMCARKTICMQTQANIFSLRNFLSKNNVSTIKTYLPDSASWGCTAYFCVQCNSTELQKYNCPESLQY